MKKIVLFSSNLSKIIENKCETHFKLASSSNPTWGVDLCFIRDSVTKFSSISAHNSPINLQYPPRISKIKLFDGIFLRYWLYCLWYKNLCFFKIGKIENPSIFYQFHLTLPEIFQSPKTTAQILPHRVSLTFPGIFDEF